MTRTVPGILAIIPAKGRSRGLPRKNLRLLCGRPLVAWTIQAALESRYVTRTVVSSEDQQILALAASQGAEAMPRPGQLAADDVSCESVMGHVVEALRESEGCVPDVLVLLQPTSPLRTGEDIDGAVALYRTRGCSAVISGYALQRNPLKEFLVDKDGHLNAILDKRNPFMPRQQLPQAFRPNGAIYVVRTDLFTQARSLLTDDTWPFYMDPKKSIDIDDLDDLLAAETILKSRIVERIS